MWPDVETSLQAVVNAQWAFRFHKRWEFIEQLSGWLSASEELWSIGLMFKSPACKKNTP